MIDRSGDDPRHGGASGRRLTVLIVDEDVDVRRGLGGRLRAGGFRVIETGTAEDALFLCGRHVVDLALVAARLPGLPGIELCRSLRERLGPPVIMLIDREPARVRAAYLDEGAEDCVDRSGEIEPIVARARAVLRRAVRAGPR